MKNFILIHGAWHQSISWAPVVNYLHMHANVITPDLPYEPTDSIHLNDYIRHILQIIEEVHGDVILVGHSFAGFLISAVASLVPDKMVELIYLNAFIPLPNESLFSLAPALESQHLTPHLILDVEQKHISIAPDIIQKYMYNQTSPFDFPLHALRKEPLMPFNEAVPLHPCLQNIPKRAIICSNDLTLCMADQKAMCERQSIPYDILEADHCPFYSAPERLAKLLMNQEMNHAR